jgi:DcmR-like sensory protein
VITRRHEAGFYSDDACFLDSFVQFIGSALKTWNAAIVVATELHRDSILPRLQAYEAGVGAAVEQGRYISVDAADTLSKFMVGGLPDPVRFLEIAGELITTAAKTVKGENARVVACGECAPLLWSQGNTEAAIQVVRLWDEIATSGVDILCWYSLRSFQGGTGSYIFDKICTQHSAVHSR